MPHPRIIIVGAGIGGSALAALLKRRGVVATVLDKHPRAPQHSYGITLERSVIAPLLSELNVDETTFASKTQHPILSGKSNSSLSELQKAAPDVRVTRAAFEDFLRKDIEVKWKSSVTGVQPRASEVVLALEDGNTLAADLVIAADGVHSEVRKALVSDQQLTVLPYAVFNGRRSVGIDEGRDISAQAQLQHVGHGVYSTLVKSTRLAFSVYEYEGKATIDFTFSRPAQLDDKLHKPDRPNSGARDIPDELYSEIDAMDSLPLGFDKVFAPTSVRQSRLLHWLMRQHVTAQQSLDEAASKRVIFLGDAAHCQPILGGNGANLTLEDALTLASLLQTDSQPAAKRFYDARFDSWQAAAGSSEQSIKQMHSPTSSVL